jgi:IrrE N-terminal-like domain
MAACSVESAQPIVHSFDACAPLRVDAPEATDAQRASIEAASAAWHAAGVAAPGSTGEAAVTIVFEPGSPALYGFFDDPTSTIFINDALSPDDEPIVIAHELGHALGLVHVPVAQRASVMNVGNLTVPPTGADHAALEAIWGACSAPRE